MSKEKFFGILVVIVIILFVAIILIGSFSKNDFSGRGEEIITRAEEMARLMEVTPLCPEERMSGFQESSLASASYQANLQYRELSGNLECDINGTDEGDCIMVGIYRREWCADGGITCLSGQGDNIGTYQFTVDIGDESYMDFTPECIGTTDTTGCCIRPIKGEGTDGFWGCEWWIYEWAYYGDGKSLNLLLPNRKSAKIWSRFADKWKGGSADEHTCNYDKRIVNFYMQSYAYKNGELKVIYVKCCPEGLKWNDAQETCTV